MRSQFSLLVFILALSGCAGKATTADSPATRSVEVEMKDPSIIDISYILGRSQYRLLLKAQGDQITGESLMDRKVVKQGALERESFATLLSQAVGFSSSPKRNIAQTLPCHSPFMVLIQIGTENHSATGCRTGDDGSFSKLVQDAEFLLVSRKR